MQQHLPSLALACALALASAAAHAADYESSIREARDRVQKSQFTQALAAAQAARAQNSQDFRSYYYEAMAQLGLGQREAAQQAVQAAQERAPASAKASLDKLAQMAGTAGQETPRNGAPGAAAVLVACTYVTTQDSDKTVQVEHTSIHRMERGNFQIWDEKRSEWSTNRCVFENVWLKATGFADVVHTCEVSDQLFEYNTSHKDADARVSSAWTINRMTGKFYGTYKYRSQKSSYTGGDSSDGTCRPVKDPSTVAPKF